MRSEPTGSNFVSWHEGSSLMSKVIVELLCLISGGGIGETRTTTMSERSVESELGDNHDRAVDILDGQVSFAVSVVKEPEICELIGEPICVISCIGVSYADESEDTGINLVSMSFSRVSASNFSVFNSLYKQFHCSLAPMNRDDIFDVIIEAIDDGIELMSIMYSQCNSDASSVSSVAN